MKEFSIIDRTNRLHYHIGLIRPTQKTVLKEVESKLDATQDDDDFLHVSFLIFSIKSFLCTATATFILKWLEL